MDTRTTPVMERVRRPRPLHDQLIGMMQSIVDERVADKLPTMGRVVGMDGIKPVVWVDGEPVARTVGFPAKMGQEYTVGMRVALSKTRSGNFHIQGSVGGTQAVVNTPQMVPNAVTETIIADAFVGKVTTAQSTAQQGVNAAANAQSTANTGVSNAASANAAANAAQARADSAWNLANAAATQSQLNTALAGKANVSHTHSEYASSDRVTDINTTVRCIVRNGPASVQGC